MDRFENFFQTVGVVAETCFAHYTAFVKVGFTPEQALDLTKTYMQTTLLIAGNRVKGEECNE